MRLKKITVSINKDECVGKWCGICASECPTEAIIINDYAYVDDDKCTGCGKCVKNICPNYAINLKKIE